jgi:hypothetical protein
MPRDAPAPEDARPATPVTLRGLLQADRAVFGFLGALPVPFIATVSTAALVPGAVSWAIMLGGTAAGWAAVVLRPSVRFTAQELVVDLTFVRRRIAWADVQSVTFDTVEDSESDTVERRVISVRYRRDPGEPLPPRPARFGEFQRWNRAHFRTVRVPLSFPPLPGDNWPPVPVEPGTSRLARRRERQREAILREFAARGYQLTD